MASEVFQVTAEQAGQTLAAFVRGHRRERSWSQVRNLIATRHVNVGGELCLDPARRLKGGDMVEILSRPAPRPHSAASIVIRHVDEHLVVVEKPAGLSSVRHPTELDWSAERKELTPTLHDLVARAVTRKGPAKPLRIVHRLDKGTSGLLVFARTVAAERGLGRQFRAHNVQRRYLAIIPGYLPPQRIETTLVRDRGDGRRGSGTLGAGKRAVTHIETAERLGASGFTLIGCRLETGRTHQIRIHLSEWGNPLCGERVYNRSKGGKPVADTSGAPRLALHAAELGFTHPVSGIVLFFEMPLPPDLQRFVETLRQRAADR